MLIEFAESGCPICPCNNSIVQRSTQKQRTWIIVDSLCCHTGNNWDFRIIVSAHQRSLYGAVAEMCEEYESFHDRSGRPDMVMGQSIVLSAIKTEVSLDCDDPTNQDLLLQQCGERIEKLSQQDKLSKFCMDAEFLSVVENGQYSWRKTLEISDNFMPWLGVSTPCQGMEIIWTKRFCSGRTQWSLCICKCLCICLCKCICVCSVFLKVVWVRTRKMVNEVWEGQTLVEALGDTDVHIVR